LGMWLIAATPRIWQEKTGSWANYKAAVTAWAFEAGDDHCPSKVWCKQAKIIGTPCTNEGCKKMPCYALCHGHYKKQ
jgi:hypothetical protein